MGDASSPASEPSPRTPAGYETSMENMTLISDLDLSSSLITQTHPTPTCSYSPPIRDAFVPTSEIPHLSLDGEYRVVSDSLVKFTDTT